MERLLLFNRTETDSPYLLATQRCVTEAFIYRISLADDFRYPAEPLTEEEQTQKVAYLEDGFSDWSLRDFRQLVRALEANGW